MKRASGGELEQKRRERASLFCVLRTTVLNMPNFFIPAQKGHYISYIYTSLITVFFLPCFRTAHIHAGYVEPSLGEEELLALINQTTRYMTVVSPTALATSIYLKTQATQATPL
jgi:hypothetical protein